MLTQEDIRGRFLKVITNSCVDRFHTYYNSQKVYTALKDRCRMIDDAIDLKFPAGNFISEVAPPVVWKAWRESSAFLSEYFKNDPIATVKPIGATSLQNAQNMQSLLSCNFLNTRFREECLELSIDNLARYGSSVVFSQFHENYRGVGLQTSYSPDGVTPYPRSPAVGKSAVCNYNIHPLNYFRDPFGNAIGRTYFEGFIDQWYISDLIGFLENQLYIRENIEKVVHDCKKGHKEEFWYGGSPESENATRDYTRAAVNPVRMFTLLNFEGNEADQTVYYCELVNDRLIRCNPIDMEGGLIPLSLGTYYPRQGVWWGNSPSEMKMSFQNLKNWIINAQIEGTMKSQDRFILVRRGGGLNVADINMRHQFGGVVFYEGDTDPSKLMYQVQNSNNSLKDLDWINRENNQMIQETSPVVNMQNKYNEGGMNNSTLGAAQMVAGIGEVMLGDTMRHIGYFIEKIAENNMALMIQHSGDTIKMRPSDKSDELTIEKRAILGEFVAKAASTMLTNEKSERNDSANMINMILNWKGTPNQEFQKVNIGPMLQRWVRAWVGEYVDTTEYYDPNAQVPPQMPQGAPGMPPNLGSPAPQQQPAMMGAPK